MNRNSGYTLIEMILVLAILVAAAAIAVPALNGIMRNTNLTAAADAVRTEWTRAHVKAMKTGRIQVYRYEPMGNKFIVEPYISDDDELEGNGAAEPVNAAPVAASTNPVGPNIIDHRTLPEGITFVGGEAVTDSRGAAAEQSVSTTGGQSEWSSPILFYPDGSSSDAYVIVGNDRQVGIRIELRGMTATARVGEVASLSNLEQ